MPRKSLFARPMRVAGVDRYHFDLVTLREGGKMEAVKNGTTYGRLPYRTLDVIEFSTDVPDHGVRAGERGQIEALDLRTNGNEVVATVRVPYSTGQTRCRLEVNVQS
jgi:hypothetical protein